MFVCGEASRMAPAVQEAFHPRLSVGTNDVQTVVLGFVCWSIGQRPRERTTCVWRASRLRAPVDGSRGRQAEGGRRREAGG